jgi:hypothetical protein
MSEVKFQDAPVNEKVAVFVCGVQKAGTTSLFSYFQEHPELQAPDRKELHFFDDERENWVRPKYGRLHRHFSESAAGRLRFDTTPIYAFWPNALARIAAYNPHAKLIFLFRDPFERAVSHWAMEFARGRETLDFGRAIRQGRDRLDGLPLNAPPWRVFSYLERGQYGDQIDRALRLFAREQMLFLQSEVLLHQHYETLTKISRFLGIGEFEPLAPKNEHGRYATDGAVGPEPGDLAYVAEFVKPDLERFKCMSQLDIANWPTSQFLAKK